MTPKVTVEGIGLTKVGSIRLLPKYATDLIESSKQAGWTLCDGRYVSKDSNSKLFDAIGYNYGKSPMYLEKSDHLEKLTGSDQYTFFDKTSNRLYVAAYESTGSSKGNYLMRVIDTSTNSLKTSFQFGSGDTTNFGMVVGATDKAVVSIIYNNRDAFYILDPNNLGVGIQITNSPPYQAFSVSTNRIMVFNYNLSGSEMTYTTISNYQSSSSVTINKYDTKLYLTTATGQGVINHDDNILYGIINNSIIKLDSGMTISTIPLESGSTISTGRSNVKIHIWDNMLYFMTNKNELYKYNVKTASLTKINSNDALPQYTHNSYTTFKYDNSVFLYSERKIYYINQNANTIVDCHPTNESYLDQGNAYSDTKYYSFGDNFIIHVQPDSNKFYTKITLNNVSFRLPTSLSNDDVESYIKN